MKTIDISAYSSNPIARSEFLLGTSNCVFSDWVIQTWFKIENDIPVAHFAVVDKMFSSNVLFETNDYKELKQWIEGHSKEIQAQIDVKKERWIAIH